MSREGVMTEARIERLAEEVLEAHGLTEPPVDPLALARLEEISLAPGRYGGSFDARIEFRRSARGGRFYLFYAEAEPPRRPPSRVRFSLGHELGHYYLPSHREYLVHGTWQGAERRFLAARRLEREADWFAAALLMPRRRFVACVQKLGRPCRLADLARLAERVFHTSLQSAALRYVQLNFAPCCVVVSGPGGSGFARASDALNLRGVSWVAGIPEGSVTGRLLAARAAGRAGKDRGQVPRRVWFGGDGEEPLWEEVRVLGRTGQTLTLLTLDEPDGPDGPRPD
jgi:hypothetical protein